MRTDISKTIARSDYQAYPYTLETVDLNFNLNHDTSTVVSTLNFRSKYDVAKPLVLNGLNLITKTVAINGQTLSKHEYQINDNELIITPDAKYLNNDNKFELSITTVLEPNKNTALMGLYSSDGQLFTQCEPEGFRRITWFPDRPDVMSVYTVTLIANKQTFPVLLSNGNLISSTDLDNDLHQAVWHDPHPKPSYLFAIVAGEFALNEKQIKTISGKEVTLQIYCDQKDAHKTDWAMQCLERSLRWDEQKYNLELDLDRFIIVAVSNFNMGAMENKGLNIFNSSYVLADPNSATDDTYRIVEAVIGHEYFHNWTGNRVTCRDWFQLSLKEGLTVFREQQFSADMMSEGLDTHAAVSANAVKRIDDVSILKSQQFPEDSGPMAHPIRPESYQEINNFYTATIYEKGAEVIRMLYILLGEQGFKYGIAQYFKKFDGQAVTCDDFVDVMQQQYQLQNPGQDLKAFRNWYSQAGTPTVNVELDYDANKHKCTVTLSQSNPPVGIELENKTEKPALHIPISMGILHTDHNKILHLKEEKQSWSFDNIKTKPILSLLRNFSAPVNIIYKRNSNELCELAQFDNDAFARWQSIQDLSTIEILSLVDKKPSSLSDNLRKVWASLINSTNLSADYLARCLNLISTKQLLLQQKPIDPIKISQTRNQIFSLIAQEFNDDWLKIYLANLSPANQAYTPDAIDASKRALSYVALCYLVAGQHPQAYELANQQFHNSNNLTDRLNALKALTLYAPASASVELIESFYQIAKDDAQIMDHWFSVQANANWADLETIKKLSKHAQFSMRNPNRARSLIFQFCLNNYENISNDAGYEYWAEKIITLDKLNPEIAARLARGLDNWSQYAQPYQQGMQKALETVKNSPEISNNVSEVVAKALSIQ